MSSWATYAQACAAVAEGFCPSHAVRLTVAENCAGQPAGRCAECGNRVWYLYRDGINFCYAVKPADLAPGHCVATSAAGTSGAPSPGSP